MHCDAYRCFAPTSSQRAATSGQIDKRADELRAAQEASDAAGGSEDCLEPVCNHNRSWNSGVEAFDSGIPVSDCPHKGASAEQDDWLRGWLSAQLESGATKEADEDRGIMP